MPASKAPASYEDCRAIFERALDAPNGLSVATSNEAAATVLRARLNKWRALDRKASTEIWPEDDPRRGRSVYDIMVLRVKGAEVRIEKSSITNYDIKEL